MSTDAQREIDRCTASIINSPNDPLLFHTRGYYYGQIGEHLKAVDDYTESIRLKPEDVNTRRRYLITMGRSDSIRILAPNCIRPGP